MNRSVRDLRELICMSRLSYHGEDEPLYTTSVPKETGKKKLSKSKIPSPPSTSGSSGKGSPLPPISKSSSCNNELPSGSLRSLSSSTSPEVRPIPSITRNATLKTNFESLLSYFDASIVAEWLTKANKTVSELSLWLCSKGSFVHFANFWLKEVSPSKRSELMTMEYSIVMDQLKFAFGIGIEGNFITEKEILEFMNAVLWEYPVKFSPMDNGPFFLNILMCLSCGRKHNYRQLLSNVKCSTTNKQHVQFILATRAFAIVSISSGVLDFYKQINPLKEISHSQGQLDKELCHIAEEFLLEAIQNGYLEVFKYFLLNYELELEGPEKNSLVFAIIVSGQDEMLELFLENYKHKIDINKRSRSSGNTALHAAVNASNLKMVEMLASAGADMNAWNGDCEGATPLHMAILSGNADMVKLLLTLHCDPTVKMGIPATVTPLMLAKDLSLDEVVGVLEKFKIS